MKFYQVIVKELISDGGKEKWSAYPYLVEAISTADAEGIVTNNYKGLTIEWKIVSISESKIKEVILQKKD